MENLNMADTISFKCPTCGALPNDPCIRINGTLLPGPHSERKALARGVKPSHRPEDFSQAAALIVREANENK